MSGKACRVCGIEKPLVEFPSHPETIDGTRHKCRMCTNRDARENRARKATYYREYDRRRAALPKRTEQLYAQNARYLDRHPDRHAICNQAGRIFRAQRPCEVCGSLPTHRHHPDYTQPLRIVWLCPQHHTAEHIRLKQDSEAS